MDREPGCKNFASDPAVLLILPVVRVPVSVAGVEAGSRNAASKGSQDASSQCQALILLGYYSEVFL